VFGRGLGAGEALLDVGIDQNFTGGGVNDGWIPAVVWL